VELDYFGTETANLSLCRESGVSTTVAVCHGEQHVVQVFEIYSSSIMQKKSTYTAGKHWCPHRTNFSETPRKSVILAHFFKDHREGLKNMH